MATSLPNGGVTSATDLRTLALNPPGGGCQCPCKICRCGTCHDCVCSLCYFKTGGNITHNFSIRKRFSAKLIIFTAFLPIRYAAIPPIGAKLPPRMPEYFLAVIEGQNGNNERATALRKLPLSRQFPPVLRMFHRPVLPHRKLRPHNPPQ